MPDTQYIGSRYVPVFADPSEWNSTRTYEPLTIVLHNGNSYTSKQYVPVGIELDNADYWAETGNYNAQIEQYRGETKNAVAQVDDRLSENEKNVATQLSANEAKMDTLQTNVNTQLASYNSAFHVGAEQEYTSIKTAFYECVKAGGGTVVIHEGEYDEYIILDTNLYHNEYINFVGVSKDACIWKSTTYGYNYACFAGTGNLTFSNLTLVKGIENDGASKSTKVNDGGYALHFDYPNSTGVMRVDNCNIISYENCAIGCGTRKDQNIYISNCLIKTVAKKAWSTYGCFIYHTSLAATEQTNQFISLINNTFIYDGDSNSKFTIWNHGVNNVEIHPVFINNQFYFVPEFEYYYAYAQSFLNTSPGLLVLDEQNCFGNNIAWFNYKKTAGAINPNGLPITLVSSGEHPPVSIFSTADTKIGPKVSDTYGGVFIKDIVKGYDVALAIGVIQKSLYIKAGASNSDWINTKDHFPLMEITSLTNPELGAGFVVFNKSISPTGGDAIGVVIKSSITGYIFYMCSVLLTGEIWTNSLVNGTLTGWKKVQFAS